MVLGAQVAVDELNAGGGILDQIIRIEFRDDQCSPRQAVAEAQRLAFHERVKFVIGHICSGASIAASHVYSKADVIQLSPASTAPEFTDRGGNNVFRLSPRSDKAADLIAEYLDKNHQGETVAIAASDDKGMKDQANRLNEILDEKGIKVLLSRTYPGDSYDISKILFDDTYLNADVIVNFSIYWRLRDSANYLRKIRKPFLFLGGITFDTVQQLGDLAGTGALMIAPLDPTYGTVTTNVQGVQDKFRAQGIPADAYAYYSYAAVQVLAQAIEGAQSTDFDAVLAAMRQNQFGTVLGDVRFDDNGDSNLPGFAIYEWTAKGLRLNQ